MAFSDGQTLYAAQLNDALAQKASTQGNQFSKTQAVTEVTLTYAATVTMDLSLSNNFRLVLTGGVTLANPTNPQNGAVYNVLLKQDGTGGRTTSFGSKFKFPGGTVPTMTTTANARNRLVMIYDATDDVYDCNILSGVA